MDIGKKMNDFFDELETRESEVREAQQFGQLREQLRYAKANIPAYADLLREVDPEEITDRTALSGLAVTRKSEMGKAQAKLPPLGGYTNTEFTPRSTSLFGAWAASPSLSRYVSFDAVRSRTAMTTR